MYDRTLKPIPEPPSPGFRNRAETLIGITGWRMAKYRTPWKEIVMDPIRIVWRPHVLPVLLFEALLFGFGIGINVRPSASQLEFYSAILTDIRGIGHKRGLPW